MGFPGFVRLHAEADRRRPGVPIAVAGGADASVLEAMAEASRRGWAQPILAGRREEIERLAADTNHDVAGWRMLDVAEAAAEGESDSRAAARLAVAAIRQGEAAALMKGQVATPDLMKAVLDKETGLRTGTTICQVVLLEVLRDARVLMLADTGITPRPTPQQRIEIVQACVEVAEALGVTEPRVALMAASEKPTPALPDTEEAAEIARQANTQVGAGAGLFRHAVVSGPLSFDLAYEADAGAKKRIDDPVVGRADVMVFPDLTSANLTVKSLMYAADTRFGGLLKGTTHPVVFMSRADTPRTRLNSLALVLEMLR